MASADRERWNRKFREGHGGRDPSACLVAMTNRLKRRVALDLAAGWGANADHLRGAGFKVFTVDIADAVRPDVLADLESFGLRAESVDTIVCTRYLERALLSQWIEALRPGGTMFIETYAAGLDPKYCLKPGELRDLTPGLERLYYEEGPEIVTMLGRRRSR